MIFLLLNLLVLNSHSISFKNNEIEKKEISKEKSLSDPHKKIRKSRDSVSLKSSAVTKEEFKAKLSENAQAYNVSVNETLDNYFNVPIVIERKINVRTLDTYKGFLPDSLILTRSPSEVIVKSSEVDGPLADTRLRCLGSVVLQRAKIYCDLMVTPDREVKVRVLIREDHDGASTILPDKYYTGEEARFIKQSFSAMFAGAMDASKDRFLSANGEEELVNSKNKIYEGFFNVGKNAQNELKNEASDVEIAAVINSGRKIRIEFLEGVRNE